ncbi:armadillo-type protein [Mycena amicta]|nr:armadillo-type protein [Mycena amicta]
MPPLSRQRTFETGSILSWWSDSNPPGATINLHALAKPLMGRMYHRQVLGFIKKIRGTPLSEETLQLCWNYLAYKHLLSITKKAILSELCDRARSVDEAQNLVNSVVFCGLTELLQAPGSEVRRWTCLTVGELARHKSTSMAVLGLNPCLQLVSLLQCALLASRDQPIEVIEAAMYALSQIVHWQEGAKVASAAKALDHVMELLQNPASGVRRWTCWTVGKIAMDDSTSMAVLELNPCPKLVSLLQDQPVEVIEAAMYALSRIVSWQQGAEAASAAKALDHVMELLQHPASNVRRLTCRTVGRIVVYKSTSIAVLELNPCPQLVDLLRDQPDEVTEAAMYALSRIVSWQQGAEAASAAKALDHVMELLQHPASEVRTLTCWTVGSIAATNSTSMAVLELNPCPQLVDLLRDQPDQVTEAAMYALSRIVSWQQGAEAASAAKALDHVMELLQHPASEVRRWTCWTVGSIAATNSTSMAVLELNPCSQLVSLLRDQPVDVIEAAMYALSCIVSWQEGAVAASAAKALDHVMELLQHPASEVRTLTCWTVGSIAATNSTSMAVLELNPCPQLVDLLRDQPDEVTEAAMYALSRIVSWQQGAEAASAAKALDHVMELLQHPASEVRRWTCWTVGSIAATNSTSMAVLELNPCSQLVSLLRDHPVEVIEAAMYALSQIVSWQQGAKAASAAKALDHVMELLQHPASEVRRWTCWTVGSIAVTNSTSIAQVVLELNPCSQLVSLLRDQPVDVIEAAMYALSCIVSWQEGAVAASAAKALDHVMELLQHPASEVRTLTCWTVGSIAATNSTSMAVLELNPCSQLVSLLRDQPVDVIEAAMYALSQIVSWKQGAKAASAAKALAHVMELLQHPASEVRRWTCWTVGRIAAHKSRSITVLELNLCPQLVGLLRSDPFAEVIEAATYALSQIEARSEEESLGSRNQQDMSWDVRQLPSQVDATVAVLAASEGIRDVLFNQKDMERHRQAETERDIVFPKSNPSKICKQKRGDSQAGNSWKREMSLQGNGHTSKSSSGATSTVCFLRIVQGTANGDGWRRSAAEGPLPIPTRTRSTRSVNPQGGDGSASWGQREGSASG